jgi:gamma-glutamyl hydrolase
MCHSLYRWSETSDGIPYEVINHSFEAVMVTQYMANFFISEARKSFHSFTNETEKQNALIYNYQPVKTSDDFVQTYFFHF